jgi:hypothetical protein
MGGALFTAEEEPIEDVEQRDQVVEENIGDLFHALGVPDVAEQKRVAEAYDGDVDSGGSFKVGVGAIGGEGDPGADAGDEEIAEDGEEAAIADDDGSQVESFGESIGNRKIEAEGEGEPGQEREERDGCANCRSCGHGFPREVSALNLMDNDVIWTRFHLLGQYRSVLL